MHIVSLDTDELTIHSDDALPLIWFPAIIWTNAPFISCKRMILCGNIFSLVLKTEHYKFSGERVRINFANEQEYRIP